MKNFLDKKSEEWAISTKNKQTNKQTNKERQDRLSNRSRKRDKRRDGKVQSNDSPEIPDGRETQTSRASLQGFPQSFLHKPVELAPVKDPHFLPNLSTDARIGSMDQS